MTYPAADVGDEGDTEAPRRNRRTPFTHAEAGQEAEAKAGGQGTGGGGSGGDTAAPDGRRRRERSAVMGAAQQGCGGRPSSNRAPLGAGSRPPRHAAATAANPMPAARVRLSVEAAGK